MSNETCVLCGQPADTSSADHGNRAAIACTNPYCGDYEISRSAERKLGDNQERKAVLQGMVVRANKAGKILDISIASDGLLQTTGIDLT